MFKSDSFVPSRVNINFTMASERRVSGPSTSTRTATTQWSSLPLEIRQKILETFMQQKTPGWSSIASVCKEWQFFIEKQNFRRLKLIPSLETAQTEPSCLDVFKSNTKQREHLVRHIWLNIELPKYTCRNGTPAPVRNCDRQEGEPTKSWNSSAISQEIWKLFSILSTWRPRADGLTLELNTYSPSDSKHFFKNYYFDSDMESYQDGDVHNHWDDLDCWADMDHDWLFGRQLRLPKKPAILRIFGPIRLLFRKELPQVGVFRHLIIRRQLRRWLALRPLLNMINKLDRLEELTYEPWRVWEQRWSAFNDHQWTRCLTKNILPQTVKKLAIFEDFREDLATKMGRENIRGQLNQVHPTRIVDPRVGAAFASRSLDLEHLSVAYMINAEDFFQACNSTWIWERLESLSLTSQLLKYHERPGDQMRINALLHAAGMTALRMPKLHTMVLWNGIKGSAFAFIYRVDRGAAFLTCRGTWKLEEELSSDVLDLWERVALESHSCILRVAKQDETISSSVVRSHGDAIHLLDLPCQVVAPVSLWQIKKEHETYRT